MHADVEIPFGSHQQFGKNAILLEPNGLVALKSPMLVGDLETLPLIESVGTSGGWKTWKGPIGENRTPQFFVDSFGAALNLAVHGSGVALVSEILAHHALDAGQLVLADNTATKCNEGYYLRVNEKLPTSTLFKDWLLQQVHRSV